MTHEFSPGRVVVTPETGEIVAIRLEGEFDLATTPPVLEEAQRRLDDHKHLILDLNGSTFIDSSVINVIIRTHRAASERGLVAVLELAANAVVERAVDISAAHLLACRRDPNHPPSSRIERSRRRVIGSGRGGDRLPGARRPPSNLTVERDCGVPVELTVCAIVPSRIAA